MRIVGLAVVLVSLATAAQAQVHNSDRVSAAPVEQLYYVPSNAFYPSKELPADQISCLIRKSNGHRECRTLDGWRKVAKEIEARTMSSSGD